MYVHERERERERERVVMDPSPLWGKDVGEGHGRRFGLELRKTDIFAARRRKNSDYDFSTTDISEKTLLDHCR